MTSATLKLDQPASVSQTGIVVRKASSELAYALLMLSPIIALVGLMFCTSHINAYLLRCIALVAALAFVLAKPTGAAIANAIKAAKSRPAKPAATVVAAVAQPVAAEPVVETKVEAEPELVTAA